MFVTKGGHYTLHALFPARYQIEFSCGWVRDYNDELLGALAELADADQARLTSVAGPWSRSEEFFGQGDPRALAELLGGRATGESGGGERT